MNLTPFSRTLGVILQVAIAHAQFETIHPYEDGNGRTGGKKGTEVVK